MRSADEQRYFLSFASLMLHIYLIEIKKEEKTCSNIKEKKKNCSVGNQKRWQESSGMFVEKLEINFEMLHYPHLLYAL